MSALESSNFTEYFQRALAVNHDNPVLAYPGEPHGFTNFRRYTLPELKTLTDSAAAWYVSQGLKPRKHGQRPLVVAICTRGDIDWAVAYFAVGRMGKLTRDGVTRIGARGRDGVLQ